MKSIDGARVISLLQAFSVLALSTDEIPEVAYVKKHSMKFQGFGVKFRSLIREEKFVGHAY